MKRFTLVSLLAMLTMCLHAYDFKYGDLYYNVISDGENGESPKAEVTYQEWDSPDNYSGLTSVVIPETVSFADTTYSVVGIGYYAFSGCTGLTSITIPDSVTSIGSEAFLDCSGLTSVIWNAKNVSDFESLLFSKRIFYSDGSYSVVGLQITSFVFGEGVEHIPAYLCYGMSNLTSLVIPNSVTSIGREAFSGCSGLTSITIPNSVTSIGGSAFSGCTGLTSITIPDSVTNIGESAFSGCTGLTSITIPDSVTNIGESAFSGCTGLTSITIPDSVTNIGESAFSDCIGLTSITIPDGVTSIGDKTFRGCSGLTSIVWNAVNYPDDFQYGRTPFYSIWQNVYYDGTIIDTINVCSQITSFIFGEGVEHIPAYLCFGMSNLTSIVIPNSVTSIGNGAFIGCERIPTFILQNPNIEVPNDCFSWFTQLDTVVMPAKGFDVSEESWASSPKCLKYAKITGGEMTDNAFGVLNRSYRTLQTLDIQAVSNTSIADEAFKGCYNLQTLLLPSQLTKIPYMAVADCKSLQEVTIPATVEEIDNSAFENCRSIQTITFEGAGRPQGAAQYAPAAGCALHRIGNWAFYNCHELQHLTIPEGVTEIGDAAFYGCTYLQDLTLPAGVEKIGDNCFALCSKLQKITVLSTTPPAIAAKTFYEVNRTIPVYVPAESVADYENDIYWKEFNIQANATPIDYTQADETTSAAPRKVIRDGQVYIERGGKTYSVVGSEIK